MQSRSTIYPNGSLVFIFIWILRSSFTIHHNNVYTHTEEMCMYTHFYVFACFISVSHPTYYSTQLCCMWYYCIRLYTIISYSPLLRFIVLLLNSFKINALLIIKIKVNKISKRWIWNIFILKDQLLNVTRRIPINNNN